MVDDGRKLDSQGNLVDMQGAVLVPSRVMNEVRAMQWQQQGAGQHWRGNLTPIGNPGTNFAAAAAVMSARSGGSTQAAHSGFVTSSPLGAGGESATTASGDRLSLAIPGSGGPHDAFTSAPRAQPRQVTTFAAQPSRQYSAIGWLPEGNLHVDSAYPAAAAAWLSAQQQPGLDFGQSQPSPQRQTPTIRVTTDFAGVHAHNYLQPQDAAHSAASSASSLPPDSFHYNSYHHSGHLSPQTSPYMPHEGENMQTPVSPISAHETGMTDPQLVRKRSHSVMSQQEQPVVSAHSRSGSIASMGGASPGEPYSPRGTRTVKRGDPPTNLDNKYICDFAAECRGLTFDRKCEWSKHMDKHDRPYRCPHPSCAKLQGFTYSGGLLRHEREVHGKHGGPKAQLMCPHLDCKRHNGKGFTRKENLNEHLRRVHSMKDPQSQSQHATYRRDGVDAIPSAEEAETPASGVSEGANLEELTAMTSPVLGKRKRSMADHNDRSASESMDDTLVQEIKRLQAEAAAKDEQIRQLQEDGIVHRDKVRRLEEMLSSLQQQGQG